MPTKNSKTPQSTTILSNLLTQENLSKILSQIPLSIAIFDEHMNYITASQQWCDNFSLELTPKKLISQNYYQTNNQEQSPKWELLHKKALEGKIISSKHLQAGFDTYISPQGKVNYINWQIIPIRDKNNQTTYTIFTTENINPLKHKTSHLRKRIKQLENLINNDPLTNLPNKNLFLHDLTKQIDSKPLQELTIIYFAITNLANINQFYGPQITDNIILEFSSKLKELMPRTTYRISGKRFSTVLDQKIKEENQTIKNIKKITRQLNKPIIIDNYHIDLQIKSACTNYPKDAQKANELDKAAFIALNQARDENKITTSFSPSLNQKKNERFALETLLKKKNIKNNNFIIYYQPQIDSKTNMVTGLEALLRWKPQESIIPPKTFIPIAEKTGIIEKLGYWVIENVCQTIRTLTQNNNINLPAISINLSPYQFSDPKLSYTILKLMKKYKIKPSQISFEITESAIGQEKEASISQEILKVINKLNKQQIYFSIDDFGTQASNLFRVKDIPFSNLKIDKSFIKPICENPRAKAVVAAIQTLAHGLDANVIAEGVEKENQLYLLQGMGIYNIQGYYYSKPQPIDIIQKHFF
jgi:diguanylate cyclase (GGDEF)-like protein